MSFNDGLPLFQEFVSLYSNLWFLYFVNNNICKNRWILQYASLFLFQGKKLILFWWNMGTTLTEEQYHLKWNDYHSSLTKCFRDLRTNDEMLDVAIIADGRTFKAHKLVLSACSPVFKAMLKKGRNQPFLQPFIFLHGVNYEDIQALLDFMYNGEVSVSKFDLTCP